MVDALPTLAHLLTHMDNEIVSQACYALSYICRGDTSHSQRIQAVVNTTGVCKRLVALISHHDVAVQHSALYAVAGITMGDELQLETLLRCSVLSNLNSCLHSKERFSRKAACCAIANIAGERKYIEGMRVCVCA